MPDRPPSPRDRWFTPAAVLALFALTLLVHRRIVFGGELPAFGDGLRMSFPERSYLVDQLAAGRFPLWLPYEGLGEPFLAQLAPGLLHPLNLLYLLLPLGEAFAWNTVLATFLAGWGAFVFARQLGASRTAALVAGGLFGLSGPLVTQANLHYLVSNATVPWAAAGLAFAVRRPRPLPMLLGALGPALVLFGGDPQSVLAALSFGLLDVLLQPRESRKTAFLTFAACAALSGLVAAIQLFPSVSAFAASDRAHGSFGALDRWSLPPMRLAELVSPGLFARPEQQALLGTGENPWTPAIFSSPLLVMLAVLGASLDRRARAWIGLGVLFLWAALGPAFGLYRVLGALPILRAFEYPEKLLPFALLAFALAAAIGFDGREYLKSKRILVWSMAAVLLVIACGWRALTLDAPGFHQHALHDFHQGLLIAVVGVVLLALPGRWWTTALILAISLIPQAIVNSLEYLVAPKAAVLGTPWAVGVIRANSSPTTPPRLVPLIAPDAPDVLSPEGVAAARAALRTAFNLRYGLESLDLPYHPFEPAGFTRVLPQPWPERVARVFGAEFATVLGNRDPGPDWTLVARHPQLALSVWKTTRRLPRAYVAPAATTVDSHDTAIAAVTSASFHPAAGIVVECPVNAADSEPAPRGSVEYRAFSPDEVELAANLERDGFVVLNDAYAKGWRATVDGVEVPICRANALVRAIRVSAGTHDLRFTYEPLSWRLGALVSLVTVLGFLVAELVRRRRYDTQSGIS